MAEMMDDHSHCDTCILRTCQQGCAMVSCDLHCGAIFHWCKLKEHMEHCMNARVSCINKNNGCPHEMPRRSLGSHLSRCPASAVCCTSEWNRWPLHTKDRNDVLSRKNFHAKVGQLDVSLALRDQRCLSKARKASQKLQKVLKDSLNQNFPAVPLVSPDGDNQIQYNESIIVDHQFTYYEPDANNIVDVPQTRQPGLQSSICDQLFRSIQCDIQEGKNCDNAELNSSDPGCGDVVYNKLQAPSEATVTVPDISQLPRAPSINMNHMLSLDLTVESVTRYQAKPPSMYTFLCAQIFRRDEYAWHVKNIHSEIHSGLNGWLEQRCPLACYGCQFSIRRMHPNNKGSQIVYSPLLESFGLQPQVPSILSHCDAMNPSSESKINDLFPEVHSDQPVTSAPDSLLSMPLEVLEYIALYLDGFSLNNMAMTCRLLRDVCHNVLPDKGLVIPQWERQAVNGKQHWYIAEHIWMFSEGMSEINTWGQDDQIFSLSNHLSTCAFNIKLPKKDPQRVIFTTEDELC